MCAINGFNFKEKDLILKMNKVTRHRGPDGTGIFINDDISLGHNRLSVIDLSSGASQPMKSEDGRFVLIFNGEIYNFKELKKELKNEYNFKTKSDTEVVLASYKKWGKDCLKKFDGIFAFVIWDTKKKELFLARDPMGVKPLYYFQQNDKFIFSSEVKAILECRDVPRRLQKEAFNHYLRILYVPEPLTMFKGILKLSPASFGVFKEGNLKIEKYCEYDLEDKFDVSKKEIEKRLREQIFSSVKSQLVSDKPLGIYLSGGIDSSVILDVASKFHKKIDTFSIGFKLGKNEESKKFNADFNLARKTAKVYKTNHHEVLFSSNNVLKFFEKAAWHMDEPISNPTSVVMLKIAEFAKRKVDVVLGGDGGDELFGGYERYRLSLLASYYQKYFPRVVRNVLSKKDKFEKLNIPAGVERFMLFMFQKDKILKRVIVNSFFDKNISKDFFDRKYFEGKNLNDFESMFMDVDISTWLMDESLVRSDKMSMAFGIELRVPFLSKELIKFAHKIPTRYKVSLTNTKIILRDAFKNRLPRFLFTQPKRGWFSPGAKWLRCPEVYEFAKTILSRDYHLETKELFNWREVKKILEDHKNKKEYNLTIIWAILTFQVWAKRYNVKI